MSKNNEEIEKYRNNEIVKKLNLTDSEFRKYISTIKQMVDSENSTGYATELVRINGKLELKTVVKEKIARYLKIKNNYLIKTFSDKDLEISLTKDYFSKVDPSKAKLLN
jgi:hypothetical protein